MSHRHLLNTLPWPELAGSSLYARPARACCKPVRTQQAVFIPQRTHEHKKEDVCAMELQRGSTQSEMDATFWLPVPNGLRPAAFCNVWCTWSARVFCACAVCVCCCNRTKDSFVHRARGCSVSSKHCALHVFSCVLNTCVPFLAQCLLSKAWASLQCFYIPVERSFRPRPGWLWASCLSSDPARLPFLWQPPSRLLLRLMLILLLTAP